MKIAVIGSITRDRIVLTKRGEAYNQTGGGVYYVSMALGCLGVDVVALPLLAKKDEDLLGSLDHPKIKVFPQWTGETTTYENTYPDESLDLCEKKNLSSAQGYLLPNEAIELLRGCHAVHLVQLSSEEFVQSLFKTLRVNYEGRISLDGQGFTVGEMPDLRSSLAGNIDIMKVDEDEAKKLTAAETEQSAMERLALLGIGEVIVTKASRGSVLRHDGRLHPIPAAKPRRIVDATGCGDTYMAGYLAKRAKGLPPLESANFASRIAALSLGFKGALTGDFTGL